ncbi:MAG: hypothetical protein P1U65_15380 [Minwuia sp.]|nr:hypothetical protein [Minwuia sp.]
MATPYSSDNFHFPTETFDHSLTIDGGDRQIEVFHAPSETDDAIGFWIAGERVLYGGSAVIQSCPNVGTPLRTMRDAIRWAETLARSVKQSHRTAIAKICWLPGVVSPTRSTWRWPGCRCRRWLSV